MARLVDLTCRVYGRLVVVEKAPRSTKAHSARWNCRCLCGTMVVVDGGSLTRGFTRSCGCLVKELAAQRSRNMVSHGHAGAKDSPTYITWTGMKRRCKNPNASGYHYYGGRGITYDPRWESFENFLADMGYRPAGKTLDRVDVNGNYETGNCRWATPKEQATNRRKIETGDNLSDPNQRASRSAA